MKILLIGEIYSTNLGDGIICETVKEMIQESFPDADIEIADLSCRLGYLNHVEKMVSNSSRKEKGIKALIHKSPYLTYKWQIMKKRKRIKNICNKDYDLAIFAGGNLFMDYFVLYIATFVQYLSKRNIPILFHACGAGNVKDKILLTILRKTLEKKNIISISSRDNVEKINKEYLSQKQCKKTCDPALCNEEVYHIEKQKDSTTIGLGVMKVLYMEEEEIIKFWLNIVKQLDDANIKWQIFCNGEETDYRLAKQIIERLGKETEKDLAKYPTRPKELVEIISNYDKIISFRLHSHIIAYALQIPSLAFEWDAKVGNFFKDIGHAENCLKIQNNVNIVEKIQQLIYDKQDKINLEEKKQYTKNNLASDINEIMGRETQIES